MIALFKSLGSKHMCSVPSGLHGYATDETHSVDAVTGVMICRSSTCLSVFFYLFFVFNWYFAPCMLDWWNGRVCPYCVGAWHVSYSIKRLGGYFFNCYNITNIGCGDMVLRNMIMCWMVLKWLFQCGLHCLVLKMLFFRRL